MSKSKLTVASENGNETDAVDQTGRSIDVKNAEIKDDFCNYGYEVASGKDIGFPHQVKGKGIVDDDLINAFKKLGVHLAVIDDVFKHSGVEISSISKMHTDKLALLYNVTGFKIKGDDDSRSVILIGTKFLSSSARMKMESPKIAIDNASSYPWHKELSKAIDKCLEEVVEYHEGKFTVPEREEEEGPLKQTKITFGSGSGNGSVPEEFENE